jgi:ornithine cyclodeaminase/alanine dehydrogenase-like protein (mu-crystallin family)
MPLLVSDDDIKQLPLSIKAAIPIMEDAFRLAGEGNAHNPPRYRIPFENGFLHAQPAALQSRRIAGMKLLANFGGDTSMRKNLASDALNFLYDMNTGKLMAIVHCHKIGAMRTAAVSAVAARHLSPENASAVGLYGTGRIAEGQLEAICAVRPITSARVYSRNAERREGFCKRLADRLAIEMIPATAAQEVPRDAVFLITATTS